MRHPKLREYLFGRIFLATFPLILSGCVLAPSALKDEERTLESAGKIYAEPVEKRDLPELPAELTSDDILNRALLANGELEAAYYRWAAAVHRVQQAGSYPNTPLSTSFSYMFPGGDMKSFDRLTFNVGPDSMETLSLPPKVYQKAKVAFDEAQAEGKKFIQMKSDIQRKAMTAWSEYVVLTERIRLQEENASLLKLIFDTSTSRVQAGGTQEELLRSETEYLLADNELQNLEAELPQQRATLNAILGREPMAPMSVAKEPFPTRIILQDDAKLLELAATNNPELQVMAAQVKGREDALELARLQFLPDFNPFAGFTGSVSQVAGIGISIPTFLPALRGGLREARAQLQEATAMYRQSKLEKASAVIAALYTYRNSERQKSLLETHILPIAKQGTKLTRFAYSAGTGSFLDLIQAQRTFLEVQQSLLDAQAIREQSLAELEALIGQNIEARKDT